MCLCSYLFFSLPQRDPKMSRYCELIWRRETKFSARCMECEIRIFGGSNFKDAKAKNLESRSCDR